MKSEEPFASTWISPPGETIADVLEEREMSREDFADQLGRSIEFTERLLSGREKLVAAVAQQLSTVLGGSAHFWITRETQYRARLLQREQRFGERSEAEWLASLPVSDMKMLGWIDSNVSKGEAYNACLQFFGVPDAKSWQDKYAGELNSVALRTSPTFESDQPAVAAWLRKGEIEAAQINCAEWDAEKLKDAIPELRKLTRISDRKKFMPALVDACAAWGVAVVVARAPKGCKASGATKFLGPKKALILLSARHLSDDHFWFTFFHEIGHLLLHGKDAVFIDVDASVDTKEEKEANAFATDILIPPKDREQLIQLPLTTPSIVRFATRVGVSAGIVVGQLYHHKRIPANHFVKLKRFFDWEND